MEELEKLRQLLKENNIDYTNKSIFSENDGIDIDYKDYEISIISHAFSYGGKKGLLEMMASFIKGEVRGCLTADEVIKEITTLGGIKNNV